MKGFALCHTCVPLEACAPFGSSYNFISMYVTRFEERVRAWLIPVQVEALDLWLVQLEVKIRIQPREHPTQRLLAKRGNPYLKLCWEKKVKNKTVNSLMFMKNCWTVPTNWDYTGFRWKYKALVCLPVYISIHKNSVIQKRGFTNSAALLLCKIKAEWFSDFGHTSSHRPPLRSLRVEED